MRAALAWFAPLPILTGVGLVLGYALLGAGWSPYLVPYRITVASAAAPEQSLSFLFSGAGLFVLPVIAIYTIGVYWVLRGKVRKGYD